VVLGISAGGCAANPEPNEPTPPMIPGTLAAYPASMLDEPPRLVRCSRSIGPPPSAISGSVWESVSVRYVVGIDGMVDPTSMNVTQSRGPRGQGSASAPSEEEALQRALSCRYEPGRKDHVPVPTIVTRRFRISVGD
jgi:hypothetical protein